ncbi:hypothetical protein [uncultured Cohaesibacter sp.]|uniref:hypothetical protein n=1 Tax=uncultured Cohaesibacter sp. TaxID=1002546 RepID=UPI0029C7A3F2|nr:hypothetical protein [uncultured Cohaesibacter sp.]
MGEDKSQFLTFLNQIYGQETVDQIARMSGLDRADLAKASEVFVPTFLSELVTTFNPQSKSPSSPSETAQFAAGNFWPKEISEAMAQLFKQGSESAKAFARSGGESKSTFPNGFLAGRGAAMEDLHKVFMGQMAQMRLMEEAKRATGLSNQQLSSLFPMLTTYGLLPLSPQMLTPALDDPAGWVNYWGELGRRSFREAKRDFGSMPSPLNAAFEGLLAGLYPDSTPATAPQPDPAKEVRDASLELQAQYLKGLTSLFEHYQPKMSGT